MKDLNFYQTNHPGEDYFIRSIKNPNAYLVHLKKYMPKVIMTLQEDPANPETWTEVEAKRFCEFFNQDSQDPVEPVLITDVLK